MRILVYGFGNVGRSDDGLGVLLVDLLEKEALPGVFFDANYQLNVEDAANIADYDLVIFADASVNATPPFQITKLVPDKEITFTTHAMHPASVLALCQDIYHKIPETYLLTIPGSDWEMKEGLSKEATEYLHQTYAFLKKILKTENPAVELRRLG